MITRTNFEHGRRSSFRQKRAFFIPILLAGVFMLSGAVMLLWNAILPDLTGVHAVTYWQAMGILALSKILFGGFRGMYDHGRHHHHHLGKDLREKWMQMDPEERKKMTEEMKNEWKMRFGHMDKPE